MPDGLGHVPNITHQHIADLAALSPASDSVLAVIRMGGNSQQWWHVCTLHSSSAARTISRNGGAVLLARTGLEARFGGDLFTNLTTRAQAEQIAWEVNMALRNLGAAGLAARATPNPLAGLPSWEA